MKNKLLIFSIVIFFSMFIFTTKTFALELYNSNDDTIITVPDIPENICPSGYKIFVNSFYSTSSASNGNVYRGICVNTDIDTINIDYNPNSGISGAVMDYFKKTFGSNTKVFQYDLSSNLWKIRGTFSNGYGFFNTDPGFEIIFEPYYSDFDIIFRNYLGVSDIKVYSKYEVKTINSFDINISKKEFSYNFVGNDMLYTYGYNMEININNYNSNHIYYYQYSKDGTTWENEIYLTNDLTNISIYRNGVYRFREYDNDNNFIYATTLNIEEINYIPKITYLNDKKLKYTSNGVDYVYSIETTFGLDFYKEYNNGNITKQKFIDIFQYYVENKIYMVVKYPGIEEYTNDSEFAICFWLEVDENYTNYKTVNITDNGLLEVKLYKYEENEYISGHISEYENVIDKSHFNVQDNLISYEIKYDHAFSPCVGNNIVASGFECKEYYENAYFKYQIYNYNKRYYTYNIYIFNEEKNDFIYYDSLDRSKGEKSLGNGVYKVVVYTKENVVLYEKTFEIKNVYLYEQTIIYDEKNDLNSDTNLFTIISDFMETIKQQNTFFKNVINQIWFSLNVNVRAFINSLVAVILICWIVRLIRK